MLKSTITENVRQTTKYLYEPCLWKDLRAKFQLQGSRAGFFKSLSVVDARATTAFKFGCSIDRMGTEASAPVRDGLSRVDERA